MGWLEIFQILSFFANPCVTFEWAQARSAWPGRARPSSPPPAPGMALDATAHLGAPDAGCARIRAMRASGPPSPWGGGGARDDPHPPATSSVASSGASPPPPPRLHFRRASPPCRAQCLPDTQPPPPPPRRGKGEVTRVVCPLTPPPTYVDRSTATRVNNLGKPGGRAALSVPWGPSNCAANPP